MSLLILIQYYADKVYRYWCGAPHTIDDGQHEYFMLPICITIVDAGPVAVTVPRYCPYKID